METSQNAGLATNKYLKILDLSLEEIFRKPGMTSTSTQNIDIILGRIHRTLPISTFPNIEPVPLIQRYIRILSTTYSCLNPFEARIKILMSNHYSLR